MDISLYGSITIVAYENDQSIGLYSMRKPPSSLDMFLYEETDSIDIVVSGSPYVRKNFMLDWGQNWSIIATGNSSRLYMMEQ